MSVRPYRDIDRRKCRKIYVGKVPVGGDAPITVQSMTNTVTQPTMKRRSRKSTPSEKAGADILCAFLVRTRRFSASAEANRAPHNSTDRCRYSFSL